MEYLFIELDFKCLYACAHATLLQVSKQYAAIIVLIASPCVN